jgi:hypothetical protein
MSMSLTDWRDNHWIVPHQASVDEIADLFAVIDRDMGDARVPQPSPDWRLGITHNAVLQLATAALAAAGYRPACERSHERAILSLRLTVGASPATVDLLDAVRRRRNQINYQRAGTTSAAEAAELSVLGN